MCYFEKACLDCWIPIFVSPDMIFGKGRLILLHTDASKSCIHIIIKRQTSDHMTNTDLMTKIDHMTNIDDVTAISSIKQT